MALNEIERAVCEGIAARRGALLEDLRRHVGLPTGGGNVVALDESRRLLTERAGALGARVEVVEGDERPEWLWGSPGYGAASDGQGRDQVKAVRWPVAICRREQGRAGRPVLIAGHLDTVHDPRGAFRELTISEDGKRGVGPGCVDMKGGLVIAMAALEALEEAGARVPWTLLLNSDEETGSYSSQRVIAEEAARVAHAGGVGVALEPAGPGGTLIIERGGSGQFYFEVRGRSAHVGRDFTAGISAVNALARMIVAASAITDPARGVLLNIGPLEGGNATNVVSDRARAWGNVRFETPEQAAEVERKLRAIAADEERASGVSVRLEVSFIRAAKPLTPEVQRLAESARTVCEQLGQSLPFGKTAGVCDGNVMQGAGLPTLDTLGVRGGGLHTTEEWIEIDSLVERAQALAVFLLRVSEGSRT